MIGYALLGIAILLYPIKKKYSLLIFFAFCSGGFQVFTQRVLDAKTPDLAALYTVVICIYSYFVEKKHYRNDVVHKLFIAFIIFFIMSMFFSLIHYGFSIAQIIQGSRMHWTFLSLYFLQKTRLKDVYWLIRVILYITVVIAFLYIIQVITGFPVLPYSYEASIDVNSGIGRYYNYPFYLSFSIYIITIFPKQVNIKMPKICLFILFLALLCTQGRTMIISLILVLFVGLWLNGHKTKLVKAGVALTIFLLPFADFISSRFSGGGTDSDIQTILSGKFINDFDSRTGTGYSATGGTMSYRFAWVYERAEYLSHRPLSENIFGLGLISDSQVRLVNRLYKFNLGLTQENGYRAQLITPDISYGNFLTRFGYVGGSLLLMFWVVILVRLFKNRRQDPVIFSTMLVVFFYFINSLAGSTMSNMTSFALPYLVLSLIYRKDNV